MTTPQEPVEAAEAAATGTSALVGGVDGSARCAALSRVGPIGRSVGVHVGGVEAGDAGLQGRGDARLRRVVLDLHLVSSTVFDIGVYLVVLGMMLDLVRSLGAGIDQQAEEERTPMPRPESTTALPATARRPGGAR